MYPELNYNHLKYFWAVARAGSIVEAAGELMVSQPTISAQIKELERTLKRKLFDRVGRRLVLTDAGRLTLSYANEIFEAGQELVHAIQDRSAQRALRVSVGVQDVIPKAIVYRLLEPALKLSEPIRLICREDKADRLLSDLSARRFDVILSDGPIATGLSTRGANHQLGESEIGFFSAESNAAKLRRGFPRSLNGIPILLPSEGTVVRQGLDLWFESHRLQPAIAGEFDDAATMAAFGAAGMGIFPAPTVVASELRRELSVRQIGLARNVRQRYYAITLHAEPEHPAVLALCKAASRDLLT